MNDSSTRKTRLQDATAATVRALAEDADAQVQFGIAESTLDYAAEGDSASALMSVPPENRADLDGFRGQADRIAFWRRYHDSQLNAAAAPADAGPEVRQLWHRLEQVRVETYGSRFLAGCRQNIVQCESADIQREQSVQTQHLCPPVATAALLRCLLTGARPDPGLRKKLKRVEPAVKKLVADCKHQLDDQRAFADSVLAFMRTLELIAPEQAADETPQDQDQAASEQPEAVSDQDGDPTGMDGEREQGEEEMLGDSAAVFVDGEMTEAEDGEDGQGELSDLELDLLDKGSGYQVYCRDYDQVIAPSDLLSAPELRALRAQLDQLTQPAMGLVNKLANRLRHLIMAHQMRRWEHDLEDGILDAKRLARIVTAPLRIAPHKQEQTQEFPSTVVSLLIDNSGSQRGKAIALAAITAEVVAATLEKCGVRTEILGFTTSEWKGGKSRQKWKADGRMPSPGRLNDLLHIEYKAAAIPRRRIRRDLGLMLQPDLLKENVDGEALIWAHDRLMALPEDRRILMVISDGAPVDDSTLSTNAPGYLDAHLRQVIESIERLGQVELVAIGIGHDVNRYYRHAVTLHRPEDLGTAVLDQLARLFSHGLR